MSDLIKREDAIKAVDAFLGTDPIVERIKRLPSADRPSAVDLSSVYSTAYKSGYEKGKADRPQGYWTKTDVATYRCSECGKIQIADDVNELNYCCCCGSRNKVRRLKGADDETD